MSNNHTNESLQLISVFSPPSDQSNGHQTSHGLPAPKIPPPPPSPSTTNDSLALTTTQMSLYNLFVCFHHPVTSLMVTKCPTTQNGTDTSNPHRNTTMNTGRSSWDRCRLQVCLLYYFSFNFKLLIITHRIILSPCTNSTTPSHHSHHRYHKLCGAIWQQLIDKHCFLFNYYKWCY